MTIKGNKGEWSEIYVFFKLLGDGKLYAADANIQKIPDIYFEVIKIIRLETQGKWEYLRNTKIQVINAETQEMILELSAEDFQKNALLLFKKIKESKGSSFSVPETELFMQKIKCKSLKAKSSDKADITIRLHIPEKGFIDSGFSIKSKLGSASTLLNAGETTNFIYKIKGNLTHNEINELNANSKVSDILNPLEKKGHIIEYYEMQNAIFHSNLQMIDTKFPEIIAEALLLYFKGKASKISELIPKLEELNPCHLDHSLGHNYYGYKLKNLLQDAALGMTPAKKWEAKYDSVDGYIVVKKDGDIVCYHTHHKNQFLDYLSNNTKFESASQTKYKYGKIYEEKGEFFIKLNLQIRFL